MMRKSGERKGAKTRGAAFVRASISFPAEVYQSLEDIAKQKKVPLAWVVRDAAENYLAGHQPIGKEK
jgi:hypothetical protein